MNLQEKINLLNQQREILKEEVKEYVQDKSNSLEDRWKLFVSSRLGDHDEYNYHFTSLDDDDFHSDLERHLVLDVEDVIEHFHDSPEEDINNFKEEAMKDFIFSWELDW
jgi:predicted house-cleaning noncanonical NTP pyrophosphatase (MazG superfamily)